MAAEDAVPNRLGLAVDAARSLVEALGREPGERVAVVAFSGRAVVRSPLSENLGAALDVLKELRPGDVTPGGTDLGAGLTTALDAFDSDEPANNRLIVVFSDGEDHAGQVEAAAKRLHEAKAVVHSVAIGDQEQGSVVPAGASRGPLVYHGQTVVSRRSDLAFDTLSRFTGGVVLRVGLARVDLGSLYRSKIAPSERQKREELFPPERAERFPLFLAAAMGCGLIGAWPDKRRGAFFAVLFLLPIAAAPSGRSAAEIVTLGNAAYATGDFPGALRLFETAVALDPTSPLPRYNAASALFRLGRYAEAEARYREARERADPGLRTKIDYALGNVSLARHNITEALAHYDDCLSSSVAGAAYDAVRRDAAINRRFAARRRLPPAGGSDTNSGRSTPNKQADDNTKSPGSSERKGQSPPIGANRPTDRTGKRTSESGSSPGREQFPSAPEGEEGSPEQRLAAALKDVHDARRYRLPDQPVRFEDGEGKDW
jgi:Ca-activated chloride channel family protein